MSVLAWQHGTTAAAATDTIRVELESLGHGSQVNWNGNEFSSSIGWGTILSLTGKVTGEAIVLDKCGGAIGGIVLAKLRECFERAFPGGERV